MAGPTHRENHTHTQIRMPERMAQSLKRSAAQNERSMNGELLIRLRRDMIANPPPPPTEQPT